MRSELGQQTDGARVSFLLSFFSFLWSLRWSPYPRVVPARSSPPVQSIETSSVSSVHQPTYTSVYLINRPFEPRQPNFDSVAKRGRPSYRLFSRFATSAPLGLRCSVALATLRLSSRPTIGLLCDRLPAVLLHARPPNCPRCLGSSQSCCGRLSIHRLALPSASASAVLLAVLPVCPSPFPFSAFPTVLDNAVSLSVLPVVSGYEPTTPSLSPFAAAALPLPQVAACQRAVSSNVLQESF
ncbi:hypothetical protein F4778DRAFT_433834 [Xylariomycetidae sp. FL2044]|nr:hypothetical protein F4778DRAFT_433834 [Xylariomycetidae sp. FL2044]